MNTAVRVEGSPVDPVPWFRRVEAVWSRFDPASSLSQLNRLAGRWVMVPPCCTWLSGGPWRRPG